MRYLILIAVLLFPVSGWGENLYVVASNAGVSDGVSYSTAFNGFADISWGVGTGSVGAGDTLYVCGAITGALTPTVSGSSDVSRITIDCNCTSAGSSYPGVINGTGVNGAVIINGKNYITVQNCTLNGSTLGNIYQTGTTSGAKYINTTCTSGARCIQIAGTSSDTIIDGVVSSGTSADGVLLNAVEGGTISNITVSSAGNQGLEFTAATGTWTVTNANVTSSTEALKIGGAGTATISITGSSFISTGSYAAYITDGGTENISITNSQFSAPTNRGILIRNALGTTILDRITVYGSSSEQIWMDQNTHNVTITNSTIRDGGSDGIGTSGSGDGTDSAHDITISNNYVLRNGNKSSLVNCDGITTHYRNSGIVITNNIIAGNTCAGLAITGTTGSGSSGIIANNTVYGNGGDWTGTGGVNTTRGGLYLNNVAGGSWIFKNNIMVGNYPYEINNTTADSLTTLTSDYNVFWHPSDTNLTTTNNGSTIQVSVAAWSAAAGGDDVNSAYADPLFVNAAAGIFTLRPESPAIDSGVPLAGTVDTDVRGFARPYGLGCDIGAYEWTARIAPDIGAYQSRTYINPSTGIGEYQP